MINKKKYILILSIIGIVFIMGVIGTYAWYRWSSTEEDRTEIVTVVGDVASIYYDDGPDIIGEEIIPVTDKVNGIVKDINIKTKNNTSFVSLNLYLDINSIDEELKHESFKYEIRKNDEYVTGGDFSSEFLSNRLVTCDKNGTNHIVLLSTTIENDRHNKYSLYIWIDGANYENPIEMVGKSFNFTLHADGHNAYMEESKYIEGTLAHTIANKFISSDNKVVVVNNSVSYEYDINNNLMYDVDGNIRYYGATPNNYIYFNCDDYNNQSEYTCEKWRIIGIVDGKVKIVKETTLGDFSWDYDSEGNSGNDWNTATLNEILNNGYYNDLDVIFYVEDEYEGIIENLTPFIVDGVGITEATRNNFISKSNWHINGMSTGNYANELYTNERTGQSSWTGNIGLMYPSDYAYAADFRVCDKDVYGYDDTNCYNNNWINIMNHAIGNNSALLITHNPTNSMKIWRIAYTGAINIDGKSNNRWRVHPTLYLEDDILVYDGEGTSSDPYKINIVSSYQDDTDKGNAIEYISNLYNNAEHTTITQGGSEMSYSYATSVNLMNDGNITEEAINGNIRYYGANPNNYIYFNCTDYNNQSYNTCELWRIIGIVDGKFKIIRDDPIGMFSKDFDSNGNYQSSWQNSELKYLLNYAYYLNMDGLKYYNNSVSPTTVNLKSDNVAIKNTTTRNLILESLWYLGDSNTSTAKLYPDIMYHDERSGYKCSSCKYDTEWTGKIGLMYPSDYGYASDLSLCDQKLAYYSTSDECKNTNWVYNDNYGQWLINPYHLTRGWAIMSNASVALTPFVNNINAVLPSVYLKSDLSLSAKGNGTLMYPYQLIVD